nr:PhzF family phenazine biosynthesis protein [Aestuariivirga litoralis]
MRIAAFSDGTRGGNPAGVVLEDAMPPDADMRNVAADLGYSETVFAVPTPEGFRVRYFSPESEVPFCGHATIALGAALARKHGGGVYKLALNKANITVEGHVEDGAMHAALQSPPTRSAKAPASLVSQVRDLFGYTTADLDPAIPPALIHGGAHHFVLALKSRAALSAMKYDLAQGRKLMNQYGLVTVLLVFSETPQLFHTRNPFASGGVYEDPATGASTAAFAGYLRDLKWPHGGKISIHQGDDMGSPSRLTAEFSDVSGSSIRVSGAARIMEE